MAKERDTLRVVATITSQASYGGFFLQLSDGIIDRTNVRHTADIHAFKSTTDKSLYFHKNSDVGFHHPADVYLFKYFESETPFFLHCFYKKLFIVLPYYIFTHPENMEHMGIYLK